jgi:hypothetical protein
MYQITKACSRGDLKGCSCNKKLEYSPQMQMPSTRAMPVKNNFLNDNVGKYEWGGCSDNVLFGYKLSKQFVDSKEQEENGNGDDARQNRRPNIFGTELKLMNLHNNEVGRRVYKLHCLNKVWCSVSLIFRKFGRFLMFQFFFIFSDE